MKKKVKSWILCYYIQASVTFYNVYTEKEAVIYTSNNLSYLFLAIKIGRYTISRKRQNDREVKTLKNEKTVGVRRSSDSSKSTSSSSPYSKYKYLISASVVE